VKEKEEICQMCLFARIIFVGLMGGGLAGYIAMQYTTDVDWLNVVTFVGAMIPMMIMAKVLAKK